MATKTYRLRSEEVDLAGFVTNSNFNNGAMVIHSPKGNSTKPRLYSSDSDVIKYLGKPSQKYPQLLYVLDYVKKAPLFVVSPTMDDARHGGVDVKQNTIVPFGIGRVLDTFNYTNVDILNTDTILANSDGLVKTFTGTLTNFPISNGTVKLKLNGTELKVSDNGNDLIGLDVTASTLDKTTGVYSITLNGNVGVPASLITTIDLTPNVDLSVGSTDKFINIEVDGVLYPNINLGQDASTSRHDIITAINTAVGKIIAIVEGNHIKIHGLIGSQTSSIKVLPPTTGDSAMNLVFDALAISLQASNGLNPTGVVPRLGQSLTIEYGVANDLTNDVVFSIFTESQFDDETLSLSVSVRYISGKRYSLTLYQNLLTGSPILMNDVMFSFDREKNSDGRSLYYKDIFDDNNPYIRIVLNENFSGNSNVDGTQIVKFTGGTRGSAPDATKIFESWQFFKKKNLYPVKLFLDVNCDSQSTLLDIVTTYQDKAFWISCTPIGCDRDAAITFRNSLNIDTDSGALYTNWIKVLNPYDQSQIWISPVAKIGMNASDMVSRYDGLPFAGVNENGLGGQLSGFQILEVENDYDENLDLKLLDESQINPIIKDQSIGVVIWGNRTLYKINTDTSFIHTRRLYNYLMDKIEKEVLKQQIFKLNDEFHRLRASLLTNDIVNPVLNDGLLNDVYVQCDEGNNGKDVLNRREFVLDVFVMATTSSEFVTLKVTRLAQGQVISQLINS